MILYANGSSDMIISDTGKTFVDFLGELSAAEKVINAALGGSCNTRIFRTSVRDLLELKKSHDNIFAIVSITNIYRVEIWDQLGPVTGNDGHFQRFQIHSMDIVPDEYRYKGYLKEWFRKHDDEAEIVNLLFLLNMFTAFLEQHNIKYLIWNSSLGLKPIDFNSPFTKSLYEPIANNSNIIDLFNFTHTGYLKNYKTIDSIDYGIHGHHGEEAHADFADHIFTNYMSQQL
jgi:hypothetical protein